MNMHVMNQMCFGRYLSFSLEWCMTFSQLWFIIIFILLPSLMRLLQCKSCKYVCVHYFYRSMMWWDVYFIAKIVLHLLYQIHNTHGYKLYNIHSSSEISSNELVVDWCTVVAYNNHKNNKIITLATGWMFMWRWVSGVVPHSPQSMQ